MTTVPLALNLNRVLPDPMPCHCALALLLPFLFKSIYVYTRSYQNDGMKEIRSLCKIREPSKGSRHHIVQL